MDPTRNRPALPCLALVALAMLGPAQAPRRAVVPTGRLSAPALREVSGIVASRRHPGVFWVHNDSGNPAAIHAVRADGTLLNSFGLRVPNVDWEDIAVDAEGRLVIGDIGDNLGVLAVRAIYRLDEPDPGRPAEGALPVPTASYYVRPPGNRFDAEGLYIDAGRAVLVTKRRDGGEAELFAVPLDPPAPLLRPATPERIGSLPGFVEPATGADISADGRRLAVCSPRVVVVYERDAPGAAWRFVCVVPTAGGGGGVEAIAWDGADLVLAAEDRTIGRLGEAAWRAAVGAER